MPELPEVETITRGIEPHLKNQKISQVVIRETRMRWPIPSKEIIANLIGQKITNVTRRAKYIYIQVKSGTLIIHLGMSGTLRIVAKDIPIKKHDHVDIILTNDKILRFNDPRRFGCVLWARDPDELAIIEGMGPEPLSEDFTGQYLFEKSRNRKIAVKNFIMNNAVVVGVGNIYASESLFLAKINPLMPANKMTLLQANELCKAIKKTLLKAIKHGGTTLKDFMGSDGKPGYFKNELKVYDRKGEACLNCKTEIKSVKIGQRMTYYCPSCQPSSKWIPRFRGG